MRIRRFFRKIHIHSRRILYVSFITLTVAASIALVCYALSFLPVFHKEEPTFVTIYSESDYGGVSAALPPGEYTAGYLQKQGIDAIASLAVEDGWQINLYREDSLGGGFLALEGGHPDLTQSGWGEGIARVTVEPRGDYEPAVRNYNYVLGTQAFAPLYGFYDEDRHYEAAAEIYKMGSNVLKTFDHTDYRRILADFDFRYIYLWIYQREGELWLADGGMTDEMKQAEYDGVYAFAASLLTEYSGTGRTFTSGTGRATGTF